MIKLFKRLYCKHKIYIAIYTPKYKYKTTRKGKFKNLVDIWVVVKCDNCGKTLKRKTKVATGCNPAWTNSIIEGLHSKLINSNY